MFINVQFPKNTNIEHIYISPFIYFKSDIKEKYKWKKYGKTYQIIMVIKLAI